MSPTRWFLTADERGNAATAIDRRHGGVAWTDANAVEVLIDGDEYFVALHRELEDTGPGDQILFTGLEGHADERLLATEASAVGSVLSAAAARGVDVRGLVWRSHAVLYNQADNLLFSRAVNDAGGQVLLDQRVRRWGSHHQKMVVILRGEGDGRNDVAFVGGMDLAHGRRDDPKHYGDPQRADLSEDNYGATPPVARRAAVRPRSGGGRSRLHVPRTVGGPEPARLAQSVAGAAPSRREAARGAPAAPARARRAPRRGRR